MNDAINASVDCLNVKAGHITVRLLYQNKKKFFEKIDIFFAFVDRINLQYMIK